MNMSNVLQHIHQIEDDRLMCKLSNMGNRPLGRPRLRWGINIKVDIQEVGCEGMD
jgi:hypothetical protein